MRSLKRKIYEIVEDEASESLAHKIFELFIVVLIILNVFAIIVESFILDNQLLRNFEIFSVIVFTIEYFLRYWTADLIVREDSKRNTRMDFVLSTQGIIDLLSILPFYIHFISSLAGFDGRILRVLRLLRLLRILKLSRSIESLSIIKKVFIKRKFELLITGFIAFIVLVIASTLMFEAERVAQPDKFPDILSTFWWAVATLTTIGYGDIYPITGVGKLISSIVSLTGIGLIALPTGILSTSFIEEFRAKSESEKEDKSFCPHCGKKLE